MVASQDDRVISIVDPELGDGPLNIVLSTPGFSFQLVPRGGRAWVEDGRFCARGLELSTSEAVNWEPQPDWAQLRSRRASIVHHLPLLRRYALGNAPEASMLALIDHQDPPSNEAGSFLPILQAARLATQSLAIALKTQPAEVHSAASQLAGLGLGMTPAGDDFLAGVMLRTWLEHTNPGPLCRRILRGATPHTSVISTAFLRAASRGECSAAWHELLDALEDGNSRLIHHAARNVLSYGHTSGADALAGFLWWDSLPEWNGEPLREDWPTWPA
jgi:hypothetical protein